ncbi:MAG: hypothetical protein CSA62_09745 [Planctomycetota bacterium]|nr:MAG: hypothetical protein CSA62_09745 [Planctomycetota bacterium]
MHASLFRFALALALALSLSLLSSCCGLYELWGCSPQQPLARVSFDSPKAALNSFRSAIRFQDSNVLYQCMGEDFKREQGFDSLSFAIFWEKLIESLPALPALGDAKIVAAHWINPEEKEFVLETYGQQVALSFSRSPSFEYGELKPSPKAWPEEGTQPQSEPDDELILTSSYLSSLAEVPLKVNGDEGKFTLSLRSDDLIGCDSTHFAVFRVGYTWKLRRLSLPGSESN